tara:strand:- start:6135 stop:6767 length:633 start_codon:yes stop_codon:yes gene_type:complete
MKKQGAVDTGIQQTTKDILEVRAGSNTISKIDSSGISNQQGIVRTKSSLFANVTVGKNENTVIAGPYSIGIESVEYDVTVISDNGNFFAIEGDRTPVLQLYKGSTYTFDQTNSNNDGHPLAFKDGSGNSYTTGITYELNGASATQTNYYNTTNFNAGRSSGDRKVIFTVPSNAPASLRYYCSVHGNGMGNTIDVLDVNASLTVLGTLVIV